MTTNVHREFESLSSAAQRTGLSIRTLRRRIASGQLAAYRNGARVRVDPNDVDRMMVRMPTAWHDADSSLGSAFGAAGLSSGIGG
jgi:excisionase family DNA binding protein